MSRITHLKSLLIGSGKKGVSLRQFFDKQRGSTCGNFCLPTLGGQLAATGGQYCGIIHSFEWRAKGWKKSRRIAVIRKDKEKHEQSGGKLLFTELEEFSKYKYVAFITNREDSSVMVWRMYNQRAECENRIKELKMNYGIEGFCLDSMWATEHAFRWVMVAHNLMALFRLTLLRNRKHVPRKSTIQFQCIAIGSYLTKSGRKTVLKLSAKEKRNEFLEGLFKNLSGVSSPFQFSNA